MGKGDKRSRRGKIHNGSYGKARKHKVAKKVVGRAKGTPKRTAKK